MTILLILLTIVFVAICAFMILIILLQPSKSGSGLGGLGGGSASVAITESLGATQGEKTLALWTKVCAGLFFVLAITITLMADKVGKNLLNLKSDTEAAAAAAAPAKPAGAGAASTTPEGVVEGQPVTINMAAPDAKEVETKPVDTTAEVTTAPGLAPAGSGS